MSFQKKEKTNKPIYNIQPIKLFGDYLQFITPLKASEIFDLKLTYGIDKNVCECNGGGIDILARSLSEIYIIELKDKYETNEKPEIAIKQAIAYATFIRELIRNPVANQNEKSWYRDIFGILSRIPDSLTIHAMIAMPRNPKSRSDTNDREFANETLTLKGHGYEDKIKLEYMYFDVNKRAISNYETSSKTIKINPDLN